MDESHTGTPGGSAHVAPPAPPQGRTPAQAATDGEAPPSGDDAGATAPSSHADAGGTPSPFGDAGIAWPFNDGGYSFETGTSYTFDSGVSISLGDGGFTIH